MYNNGITITTKNINAKETNGKKKNLVVNYKDFKLLMVGKLLGVYINFKRGI